MKHKPPHAAITIRAARPIPADADAILAVERASLGDSAYTSAEALAVLARPEHHAYLALAEGRAVGFCSTFEAPTDVGARLELDMLGVLPAHRGRGIATSLLRAAMAEARERGVLRFRGVVAVDNAASQRAFERAGLRHDPVARDLTVFELQGEAPLPYLPKGWDALTAQEGTLATPTDPPLRFGADGPGREVLRLRDEGGRFVALAEAQGAHTLAYRGLWLERHWAASPRALLALALGLVERARALGLDEVGYLAPPIPADPGEGDEAITWLRAGYRAVGRYWIYTAGAP